ncbi:MAG: hypothetical protein ACRDKE_11940, partial [Solirubrobacterales bacterium]
MLVARAVRNSIAISLFLVAISIAPSAQAATPFGVEATPAMAVVSCGTESYCNFAIAGSLGAAPAAGVVTSVRVGLRGQHAHGVLRVLRSTGMIGTYLNVQDQAILVPDIGGTAKTITYPTRLQ